MIRLLVALALLSITPACAEEAIILEGSLGEFYDLSAESVRARLYDSEFAVEYVAITGEVPVRVTYKRWLTDPTGPVTVDLKKFGDVTGSVRGTAIPRFATGTLRLFEFKPAEGATIQGDFDASFTSGQTEVTLHGEFDTTLTLVEN